MVELERALEERENQKELEGELEREHIPIISTMVELERELEERENQKELEGELERDHIPIISNMVASCSSVC